MNLRAVLGGPDQAARARRAKILAYLLPAVIAFATVQSWFEPGKFVASGDQAPFIRENTRAEIGSIWGHEITGAGSPSRHVSRTAELAAIVAADALGASEESAQRWFYSGIAVAMVVAGVYFVFGFTSRPVVAAIGGTLALFNGYMLQGLPDAAPVWALTLLGLSGGLIIRAARGQRVPAVAMGGVAALTGYVYNFPHMAMLMAWVIGLAALGSLLTDRGGTRRSFLYLARALPWCVLLSLWWVVPTLFSIKAAGTQYELSAQTDVVSWKWTHARSSIANVMTLTSNWGWAFPENFPFAARMDRTPWTQFRFAFPVLAFAAPLLAPRSRRRAAVTLAALSLGLVFVGKGLHEPLGGVNLGLYRHVPGMWLLREPSSKVGTAQILLYTAMVGITMSALLERTEHWATPGDLALGRAALGLAFGAAVLAVAYPYPLWTGDVISDSRPPLPSEHVRVPEAWREIASDLNQSPTRGKVLVLPISDYYQVPTTWGYYGSDQIPKLLLRRPTIQPVEGGYFRDSPAFASMVRGIQSALVNRDAQAVPKLLQSLGVSHLVLRRDIALTPDYFSHRYIEDPQRILMGVERLPELRLIRSNAVADVFEFQDRHSSLIRAYSRVASLPDYDAEDVSWLVGSLPESTAATLDGSTGVEGAAYASEPGKRRLDFSTPGGRFVISRRAIVPYEMTLRIEPRDGAVKLRVRDRSSLLLDGGTIRGADLDLEAVSGDVAAVRVGERFLFPRDKPKEVGTTAGEEVRTYRTTSVIRPPFSEVGDCDRFDDRSLEEVGIRAVPLRGEPPLAVRLEAVQHSACVRTGVERFTPEAPYRVRLEYRSMQGSRARICLWQVGPNRCADLPALKATSSWQPLDEVVIPQPGSTDLRLFLYADGGRDADLTVNEYRRARVEQVPSFVVTAVQDAEEGAAIPIEWRALGPSSYEVGVGASRERFLLVLNESFSPGWRIGGAPPDRIVKHLEVDGYANGWEIRPGDPLTLTISYQPDTLARAMYLVGGLSAAVAVTVALRRWMIRRGVSLRRLRKQPEACRPATVSHGEERP